MKEIHLNLKDGAKKLDSILRQICDWNNLPEDERNRVRNLAVDSYFTGVQDVIDELNRRADREVKDAQDRAIEKILRGDFK